MSETEGIATFLKHTHPDNYIEWDTKSVTDETVEYLAHGVVVMTRPRCPAINAKKNAGQRCQRGIGEGHSVCWNHRPQ